MRLREARLPRQQRDTEASPLNPAQQLVPEPLVQLGEVHLWIVLNQQ